MAHASSTSLFVQRLDNAIDILVHNLVCENVGNLPLTVQRFKEANKKKLEVCKLGLNPEIAELLLQILNTDWNTPLDQSKGPPRLVHICEAGCCSSHQESQAKLKKALTAMIAPVFPVPLLYRWKFWDEAVQYCLRNLACHRLLIYVWQACMTDKCDESFGNMDVAMDEDCPDVSPALRQRIRMNKVMHLLLEEDMLAPRCGNPINQF